MCTKRVCVFPVPWHIMCACRLQTVNKSLINQVLSTGILSDTLKFDKVMIRFYFKSIARIGLVSSSTISKVLDIFSLGRQVYLHTGTSSSMIDN